MKKLFLLLSFLSSTIFIKSAENKLLNESNRKSTLLLMAFGPPSAISTTQVAAQYLKGTPFKAMGPRAFIPIGIGWGITTIALNQLIYNSQHSSH